MDDWMKEGREWPKSIYTQPPPTQTAVWCMSGGGVGAVSCRVEVGKGRGNWETSVIVSTLKTKEKTKKKIYAGHF